MLYTFIFDKQSSKKVVISSVGILRGAITLPYFASKGHRKNLLKIKQLILTKKRSFEQKKLSMEILMEEIKSI